MPRRPRDSVFLNCPFDQSYQSIFQAVVFTITDVGFIPRCALEADDASDTRLNKIFRIVGECRYGIHDISCTRLDPVHRLPRFNMPFELGLFLACKTFGGASQAQKACLILDSEPYRYQKFLSDIAGQDIHSHRNNPRLAAGEVRNWLRTVSRLSRIPGGDEIWGRYEQFRHDLPDIRRRMRLGTGELPFIDFVDTIQLWRRARR